MGANVDQYENATLPYRVMRRPEHARIARSRRFRKVMEIAGRLVRRITARLIHGGARRGRFVAIALIALGGLIAITSLNLAPSLSFSLSSKGSVYRPNSDEEPPATAAYLRGQQVFDARLIWESYSDRVVQNLQQIGVGVDETQKQLDRAREVGTRIQEIQYIGGYPLPTGSMEFYLVGRTARSSENVTYIPYMFTLDARGKIDRVE